MHALKKTLVVTGIILFGVSFASNLTYHYTEVHRSSGQSAVAEIVDVELPELSSSSVSMAGWPWKFYISLSSPDLPTISYFSLQNLLLNIGVVIVVFLVIFAFEFNASKRLTPQTGGRRLTVLDLLVAMGVVAGFIVYWRFLESTTNRELAVSSYVYSRGGQAIDTVSLPGPLLAILPDSSHRSLRRVTEVTLTSPDDDLVKQVLGLPYLTKLCIGGGNYDLRLLERLTDKPLLTHLRLSGRTLDAKTVGVIANLKQLQVLNLMRTNITDRAIESFVGLPRLQALDLMHTDVELKGTLSTPLTKSVRVLKFGHPAAGHEGTAIISDWSQLRRLICNEFDERPNHNPMALSVINLPMLESISLDGLQTFDLEIAQTPVLAEVSNLQSQWSVRMPPDTPPPVGTLLRSIKVEGAPKLAEIECSSEALQEIQFGSDCGAAVRISGHTLPYGLPNNPPAIDSKKLQRVVDALAGERGPTGIKISNLDLSKIDLNGLFTCQRMRKLSLVNCNISSSLQLAQTRDLETPLEELDLSGNWINPDDITRIVKSRSKLRFFFLDGPLIGQLALSDAPNLERVFRDETQSRNLKSVQVSNLPAWNDQLNLAAGAVSIHLKNVPMLAGLATHSPWPQRSTLSGVRDLKYFAAGGLNLNDEVFEPVLDCQNIETLTLAHSSLTPAMLGRIAQLPSLKNLTLSGSTIDDVVIAALTSLTRLESLVLDDTAITDVGFDTLAQLTSLKRLSVSHVSASPAALAKLGGLAKLVRLSIGGRPLTAEHIKSLRALAALRLLDLSDSNLDQVTLAAVAELQKLEILVVRECHVSPTGFTELIRSHGIVVDVTGTDVPLASLNYLEQSGRLVPDKSIAWGAGFGSNPTSFSQSVVGQAVPPMGPSGTQLPRPARGILSFEGPALGEVDPRLFSAEYAEQMADKIAEQAAARQAAESEMSGRTQPMSVSESIGYVLGKAVLEWQRMFVSTSSPNTIEQ